MCLLEGYSTRTSQLQQDTVIPGYENHRWLHCQLLFCLLAIYPSGFRALERIWTSHWPKPTFSPVLEVNKLTALGGGVDGLSDLADDVAHGACDVGDAGGESLVHIGRQVLDVGDELLHLAEGADHLEGRAQLAAVCHRTQGLQQVQPRPLCGGNQEIAPSKSMQHDIIYVFSCRGKKEFSILLNKVTFNTFQ